VVEISKMELTEKSPSQEDHRVELNQGSGQPD
jgi:hypothetical protein